MAKKETEILCICNALVDIYAAADEQLCASYGITGPAQHIGIDTLNALLPQVPDFIAVSGGGAANVAKIAGLLGANVCFTGSAGASDESSDHFGLLFERDLSSAGVKLKLYLKPIPTGIFVMFKTGEGETFIAASPSAAGEFSEKDLDEEDFKNTRIVVIDGFMWDRPGLIRRILELTASNGKIAALDLGSLDAAEEHAKDIMGYINQYPLILFMNETEALAFYNSIRKERKEATLDQAAPNMAAPIQAGMNQETDEYFMSLTAGKSFPVIVVKLGERGALCFAGGKILRAETSAIVPYDATGAGDAFCAGFLISWVRNKPLSECAELGNKAARIVLDAVGTQVDREKFKNLAGQLVMRNDQ